MATGIDAGKRFQIHIHIQRQPVVTAATPHSQSQRGNFMTVHVYAGCICAGCGADTELGQQYHQSLLNHIHQRPHAQVASAQIHQQVKHPLAGAVISYLAAAIGLHHRDVPGRQ